MSPSAVRPTTAAAPYPRPALERAPDTWQSLDGPWAFGVGPDVGALDGAMRILVPFPPESAASGLSLPGFLHTVWYRRDLEVPAAWRGGGQVLLHFGAADYHARVWLGEAYLGEHVGGHTPFSFDLTPHLGTGPLTLTVRVDDDPLALDQPRGKQDWLPDESHKIWYPRTTGLWQSVWLEHVPALHLTELEGTPDLTSWSLRLRARLNAVPAGEAGEWRLRLRLQARGEVLSDDLYRVTGPELTRTIHLADGGIDDHRRDLLWSPEHPQLIEVRAWLLRGDEVVDEVGSTTALREFGWAQGRFLLNGLPYRLRLVLNQGYWPDTLMSATDEQLRLDAELVRRLGFNGVRMHQKVESPRFLHWCDQIGVLVWTELPSAYAYSDRSVAALTGEWTEVIRRDRGRPCVAAWVPFNESWGVPDLRTHPRARHLVQSLYHLARSLDDTRPVLGNDGWETMVGDLIGIHDYTPRAKVLKRRYGTPEKTWTTLRHDQPGGRQLLLGDLDPGTPVILSEFGGVAYAPGGESGWGYSRVRSSEDFLEVYAELLGAVNRCMGLAGFCYTQLTDTFQERNGLLTEKREPKAPLADLFRATQGRRDTYAQDTDPDPDPMGYVLEWRERRRDTGQSGPVELPQTDGSTVNPER
ncbi:sugar-binding domain-containing protein [uncultured Deinococcus sp.]|uniref:glycoside hydrolase family 2 protein n=1 Tax=uncultured Deinococcus sp. TaxID=158789 RepID=UPI00258A08FB|nr:sugar-binding domain-containing protein [uncultured Deinococcus sp.]